MDSLTTLVINNNFSDVFIICSDGSVSLDKLTFGILFPFLGDLFTGICFSEVFISMPDYEKVEIIEAVKTIVGISDNQSNTEDINERYDSSSVDLGTVSEINHTIPTIRKKTFSKSLLCRLCDKTFSRKRNYKKHRKSVHRAEGVVTSCYYGN